MIYPDARSLFPLEDGVTYINNGAYGLLPKKVADIQAQIKRKIDSAPGPFFAHEFHDEWKGVAAAVAERFHMQPRSLALVENATDGINAVLYNMNLKQGDEVLLTSLNYGGIREALGYMAEKNGIRLVQAPLQFPDPDPGQIVESVRKAITPRTRLALFDHVTSSTALVMPVAEMAKACHERGVSVLVDGAHAPGNIPLNVEALGVDWYAGNFHKWYFAPRSSGFLWAAPEHRSGLVPAARSWMSRESFPESFEWTGSHDTTTWLSLPQAFQFMDQFGERQVQAHNHALVREAAAFLGTRWNSKVSAPEGMTGSMALVALPEDMPFEVSKEGRSALQKTLWDRFRIEACIPSHSATPQNWVRLSAQIYNGAEDYQNLDKAISELRCG